MIDLQRSRRVHLKVVVFGALPPPIGGVTKSVENLLRALKSKSVEVSVVSHYHSFMPLFRRYDIAHIHFTKSWKRLIAIILGKIIAKKVIYTIHGGRYNNENRLNDICENLTDGAIFLNNQAKNRYKDRFKRTAVLGSLFAEGITLENSKKKEYINRKEDKTYLLVYAFDKTFRNSEEVYGVSFMLENIEKLDRRYVLVILDVQGAYKDEVDSISNNAIIYLNYEVDFLTLLSEIDIYVRPTTTDGSSVAVQEALLLEKKVLASNVVERPAEVTIYKSGDFDDFKDKLENLKDIKGFVPNSIDKYIDFCNELLEK